MFSQRWFGYVLTIFFFGVTLANSQAAQVQEFTLDNGLKVLLLEDHKSPAVTFQVWYRVGGRNEKDGKSGLAHFLEHMMFKGTPSTGPEEYSRIIAKNGGRSNAFTSSDTTVDFSTEEILAKIRAAFGKIPRGGEPPKVNATEPEQRGERRLIFKKEAELPFILTFYHAPNLKSPDNFALDLLSVVLAGGRSSRLYHELVYQKRLARNVDADYSGASIDPMGFSLTSQLLPGIQPAAVEREI